MDLARVAIVLDRISAYIDDLARARRVDDLDEASVRSDARAEREVEPVVVDATTGDRLDTPDSSSPPGPRPA